MLGSAMRCLWLRVTINCLLDGVDHLEALLDLHEGAGLLAGHDEAIGPHEK